ncbi:hypothetical protein BGZ68_000872 [Mortierella alpina]|nr:hypothetical protein BGZ68_000872 [Mortierella alpina]
MMIQHQRFQLGGRVEEIEIETNTSTGKQYVLLRDVQDVFPTAARFERDGRPVRFQSDEQGHRTLENLLLPRLDFADHPCTPADAHNEQKSSE